MRKRLIQNIFSNYLGFGVSSLVTLLLTPFLIRHLGSSQYGVWILLSTLVAYFQLLEFGLMPSIIRFVSFHRARDEKCEVEAVIGSAFSPLIVLSLLTLPVTYVAAEISPAIFNLDGTDSATFARAIWLLGFTAILSYFKRMFHAVIEGYQRFDLLNLCSASGSVIGALAMVYCVKQGGGILSLMMVLMAQTAYETLCEVAVLAKVFQIKPNPFNFRKDLFKKIFGYSYYAYLIDIAGSISYRIDTIVIGLFLPMTAVAFYSIGTRIAGFLEKAVNPLINTFFPLASELHTAGNRESLQKVLLNGTRTSILIITPGLIIGYAYGGDLIRWWVGPEFIPSSLPVLRIFLAVVFLSVFEATASRVLLGTGEVRFNANVSLYSALANLILSLSLVKYYGIVGVALGTLIPSFVSNFLVSVPYTCRLTGIPLTKFYVDAFAPGLAVLALFTPIAFLSHELSDDRLGLLLSNGALVTLLTSLVFFRVARRI